MKDKIETWLAWKRVDKEFTEGTLAGEFEKADRMEVASKVRDAEELARDEVWASYRYVVLADNKESDGLKVIDLGAGHASNSETLCGRVLTALKSQALLNESPGVSYLERKWPQAFKQSGAWPLVSLRQAFLNGSMERLLDPDSYLRSKIPEFVIRGEFGLGSEQQPGGTYSRLWFQEMLPADEVAFDADLYLLTQTRAKALKTKASILGTDDQTTAVEPKPVTTEPPSSDATPAQGKKTLRLSGSIPPEVWNRLGTKLLPKLRAGVGLRLGLDFSLDLDADQVAAFQTELRQVLQDLNLTQSVRIDVS